MNAIKNSFTLIVLAITALLQFSCTYDKQELIPESNFPSEVSAIITTKCATAGCHNNISYQNAGGLDFSSWESMYAGGRSGSSVIPFSTDYSFLLYFVNSDTSLGPTLEPRMPIGAEALSSAEYQTLVNWIANGGRNKSGELRYPDGASRKKAYICMQGCDQVAVIDAESGNIMKYVSVGISPENTEAPHMVRLSPDGRYWYVVFFNGKIIQKFRTEDDTPVGTVNIGTGDWNTIIITPDGKKGFVSATLLQKTTVIDLENMVVETSIFPEFPHGGFITPDGNYLYLTSQLGNFVNKVDISNVFYNYDPVILQPGESKTTASRYDAHEMILSPDGQKYFVSCQASNEVRIFRTANDSLLGIIPVGHRPQEFSISSTRPYLFISCTDDPSGTNRKGNVYVINYQTNSLITSVYTGYQPHGIAVNDDKDIVYVAHLNSDSNGPTPHHSTGCGGRNGYMTAINMSNLSLYRKTQPDGSSFVYRNELLTFPYFVEYKK
ncbi:MAG: YncE family protein [Bacteroidetes bacterium]|nr:MAG: YncE family protein [Bacteroidota bacterium]REK06638.1 MAG: YncE family protein [Bacteroidota bacterium]REK33404.1 MAG: YncE family protein [Bacteroidota bacterium]REK49802.1 MAG: YncE family protein [Bacteroidota bacterium]